MPAGAWNRFLNGAGIDSRLRVGNYSRKTRFFAGKSEFYGEILVRRSSDGLIDVGMAIFGVSLEDFLKAKSLLK